MISSNILLSDTSGSVIFQNKKVYLTLFPAELTVTSANDQKLILKVEKSCVISCKVTQTRGIFSLQLIYYPFQENSSLFDCCYSNGKKRIRKSCSFIMGNNNCDMWSRCINSIIQGHSNGIENLSTPTNCYLIILNPVSGQGKGIEIWEKIIKPIYHEANISYNLIVTACQNNAYDYMKDFTPSKYNAIICIGGDGIVYEVINGIMARKDGKDLLRTLPICPIPAGSGNGLAKSIMFESHHDYSVINAVFLSLKGNITPFDLGEYETAKSQGKYLYSFLQFSYGLISDVDINTEFMRKLGETRFTLGAIYYSIFKRKYKGKLSLFTGHHESITLNQSYEGNLTLSSTNYSDSQPLLTTSHHPRVSSSGIGGFSNNTLPPLHEPVLSGTPGWEIIESSFNLIWILYTSHSTSSIFSSPTSRLNDGLFTVLYCDDCSTIELLHLLILADTGEHINHPKTRKYTCTAFRFEPADIRDKGIFSLDGEIIEYGPVQAKVIPQGACTLSLN